MEIEHYKLKFHKEIKWSHNEETQTTQRKTWRKKPRNPDQTKKKNKQETWGRNPNKKHEEKQTTKKEQTGEIKPKQKPWRRQTPRTQISLTQTVRLSLNLGSDDDNSRRRRQWWRSSRWRFSAISFIFFSRSLGLMMFRWVWVFGLKMFRQISQVYRALKTWAPWNLSSSLSIYHNKIESLVLEMLLG